MTDSRVVRRLVFAVIAVQLFDIAIHVGTGQVEPVRILSNAVLGIWAFLSLSTGAVARLGMAAIVLYLGLNGWFLLEHGLTNPEQGGALRVMLFVLVGASVAIALWLVARLKQA